MVKRVRGEPRRPITPMNPPLPLAAKQEIARRSEKEGYIPPRDGRPGVSWWRLKAECEMTMAIYDALSRETRDFVKNEISASQSEDDEDDNEDEDAGEYEDAANRL